MDEDDHDSNASSGDEQDEIMEDVDEGENDNDVEDDKDVEDDDNEEEEDVPEPEPEPDLEDAELEADIDETQDQTQADGPEDAADASGTASSGGGDTAAADVRVTPSPQPRSPSAHPVTPRFRPTVRPEAVTARLYDIVPTMAAPQATSINALAVTPDMRYWMTGGTDGYIRKYDGVGTINGKQLLTVAQRHPFVDSVTKAGILMSYWENEEPPSAPKSGIDEHVLSPVYSLAVHSQALWLLSGLESGGINLQSVRHDEGKRIHCLRESGHTNAVSVLTLAPDEKSVLSGSWDKQVLDWDLNNGQVIRRFEGSGGQISALELRPASGSPIPAEASELEVRSETMVANNDQPLPQGAWVNGLNGLPDGGDVPAQDASGGGADGQGSPAHESLFGSPAGSLFGDNEPLGGGAFGEDDDDEFSRAMELTLHDETAHSGSGYAMTVDDTSSAAPQEGQGAGAQPLIPVKPEAGGEAVPNDGLHDGDTMMYNGSLFQDSGFASQPPLDGQAMDNASFPDQQFNTDIPAPDAPPNNLSQTDTQPTQGYPPSSPSMPFTSAADPNTADPNQTSTSTFFSASIDGTIRIWDRRVRDPVARIGNRPGIPPWCMGACWSPDGNWIYAGRRNGTVEEFSIHKARSGWAPERVLKFPNGSGPVSCVRPMPNGRHLVCASHDILRLYDLRDMSAFKGSSVPFLIIPGPPRAGVISSLYIDPTARFMLSAAGTRGWEGSSTEVLIGYEISVTK
ncbi:WD40 repeat-like protein [Coniochaeta ligniaria NRRL 30616]|uniref:WD40 repeat-like protein n=1 Tax=Coniochaeta ligniaria NRRL 30616 TaxID=1408157 RepID=A0A1J7ITA1_9PEZI|nr:WD40 repeat-like protein [Coniochaeta ligniaria NRRL 30616]